MQPDNEGDLFSKIFNHLNTGSSYSAETLSDATYKSRHSRWLKSQDRALVKTILILQEQERIFPELLFDNTNKNPTTKEYWDLIKAEIQTDRNIQFLQSRYRKLLRNQELNRHEKLYLSENFQKYSIQEFQILFPGKTKATLAKLRAELEQQTCLDKKAEEVLKSIPQKSPKLVEVMDDSSLVSTLEFNEQVQVDVLSQETLTSSSALGAMAPKALRKMQYTIQQISGEIYSNLYALKASLKKDLVKNL